MTYSKILKIAISLCCTFVLCANGDAATSTVAKSAKGAASATKATSSATKVTASVTKATASVTKALKKEPSIRVYLGARKQPFTVQSTGGIAILDASGKILKKEASNVSVGISGKGITINGKSIGQKILLESAEQKEKGIVQGLGKSYRGRFQVTAQNGSMVILNIVPLEEYLYGVVPEEAVPSWPKAALEAQAVAARTYALYTMEENKGKAYDISTTTNHQVYKGSSSEYDSTTQAVNSTRGMVMTYGGHPINALFHSDGGGYTESSVNVWGSHLPYLQGAPDYSRNKGTSFWVETTSRKALEEKLRAAGKSVGSLKSIQLSSLTKGPMKSSDRGISGRVKEATFIGTKGKVTVSGQSIMAILGLKSTLFDFYIGQKPPASRSGLGGKVNHSFSSGNQPVYVVGAGWGHGLGMSQWGAAAMAEDHRTIKDYYKTILTHYYKGVTIQKWY